MKRLNSGSLIVYLPIILAPIVLFSPVWLSGNVLFWGTPFLQFMPWRDFAWAMILKGQLPLWNPLVGMGAPLAANLQSAFYYPPNWLLFALESIGGIGWMAQGQTFLVILHLIGAGIGMALLARQLGLNRLAQAIAGLSFSLSGYLVARAGFLSINAAAAWMPWILLSANRFASPRPAARSQVGLKATIRDILWLGLCLGAQLLAGHAQTTYFSVLLLGAWVIVWSLAGGGWRLLGANLLKTGLALSLAVGLAAIQLLPTAEYLLQSQRASSVEYNFAMNYSFVPPRFLTLIAHYLFGSPATNNYLLKSDNYWEDAIYIGLLPLLLGVGAFGMAFIAAVRRKKGDQDPEKRRAAGFALFLGSAAVVGFILALGHYTPVFPFLYRYVPTFNMFQGPTRFSLISEFCLCLLAGVGASAWQKPRGRGLAWTRRGMAVAFALLIGAGAGLILLNGIKPTFIQGVALAGLTGLLCGGFALSLPEAENSPRYQLWSWGVVVFIAIDLLGMGLGLNPGAPASLYQAPSTALSSLRPVLGSHRLYLSAADEDSLMYTRFFTFNNFTIKESWQNLRNTLLPDGNLLDWVPSANNFDPVLPARYTTWLTAVDQASPQVQAALLALMDVGAVETADPAQPLGVGFSPRPGAARARWMGCALAAADGPDALAKLLNLAAAPDKALTQVVLEMPVSEDQTGCGRGTPAAITITRDEPGQVDLRTSGQSAGWLLLADSWYPGWAASIDGQPVPIYRGDYLFRAIRLPVGEHAVSFVYRPASFFAGLGITGLAGLVILGLLLFSRLNQTAV